MRSHLRRQWQAISTNKPLVYTFHQKVLLQRFGVVVCYQRMGLVLRKRKRLHACE